MIEAIFTVILIIICAMIVIRAIDYLGLGEPKLNGLLKCLVLLACAVFIVKQVL